MGLFLVLLWPQWTYLTVGGRSTDEGSPHLSENPPLPRKHQHTTDSNPGRPSPPARSPGHTALPERVHRWGACLRLRREPHPHTEGSGPYGIVCAKKQKHRAASGPTGRHLCNHGPPGQDGSGLIGSRRPWLLESPSEDQRCGDRLGPSQHPLTLRQPGPTQWSGGKQKGKCGLRGSLSLDTPSGPTSQGEMAPESLHHSEPRLSDLQNGAPSHPTQAGCPGREDMTRKPGTQ